MARDLKLDWSAPGPIAAGFMRSEHFVRGLRGPVGSGKTVTCIIELMRRASEQRPDKNKLRRSRWCVIRNTSPQLKTTTIATWLDWVGEDWGKFNWQPPFNHRLQFALPDKTVVDMEVWFIPLDRPSDVRKMLSLELTGAFINEAREVDKTLVDAVTMRVGRFPSLKDGGPSWYGVVMDTNAPEEDHWWPIMAGDVDPPDYLSAEERLMLVKPEDWEFFSQPGAMLETRTKQGELVGYELNPDRENRDNLVDGYYERIIQGKSRNWILVYACNEYRSLMAGKPVHPTFRKAFHVSSSPLPYLPEADFYIGVDFGRQPAAAIAQRDEELRWRVLSEFVRQDMGAERFAPLLIAHLERLRIPLERCRVFGDPSGDRRGEASETTPFRIFRTKGLSIQPAPSNDLSVRLGAVDMVLERVVGGRPGLLLDPSCRMIVAGLEGKYRFKERSEEATTDDERVIKNKWSHPCEALQYLLLGGREGQQLLTGRMKAPKAARAQTGFNPFDRQASAGRRGVRRITRW